VVVARDRLLRRAGRHRPDRSWSKWSSIRTVVLVLASAVVGALPWLWTNARDGFKSLSRSAAPVAVPASYGERLSVFFHKTLPIDLGVKTLFTGHWSAVRPSARCCSQPPSS